MKSILAHLHLVFIINKEKNESKVKTPEALKIDQETICISDIIAF